jgi:predicted pyridoxine 5'-phosphate oxidase superfamily flavin-nucleotide-binding protein
MTGRVHDYQDRNHHFRDRCDTRCGADCIAERAKDHLDGPAWELIERADMFFLATSDHRGLPTCSYKGRDPGFVRVLAISWLASPNYDGNGKYQSMGNLYKNPYAGMLFIDFEQGCRLCLQGVATIRRRTSYFRRIRERSSSYGSRQRQCTITVRGMFTSTT